MRYVDALVCVVVLLIGEWLIVGLTSMGQLAGAHELGWAASTLLPIGVLAAAPLAAGGACLSTGLNRDVNAHPRERWWIVAPAAVLATAVAVGVSSGRLLEGGLRPVFVVAVGATTVVGGWFVVPPLARAAGWLRGRGVGWLAVAGFGVAGALEVANRLVLVRLYPAFHLGLGVLAIWAVGVGGELVARAGRPIVRRWLLVLGLGACAALAVRAPARLRRYDNLRFVFLERAPLLSHAVELAAWLAPPPPVEPRFEEQDGVGPSIDLAGRDVLLITVDALRADHVGAYGYERPTTPELDALAAEGAVFEAAYTPTPHTSYAVTSLMTGKYMRPLLVQDIGHDSETWATALRRYGYRTAAFFPPAVFFVDAELFGSFSESALGFEYQKRQFSSAVARAEQVKAYLADQPQGTPLFLWVHLFEPHEPYEAHPEHDFGDHSIDLYDAEIAAADAGLGAVVRAVRAVRPNALVIVTADHGEEFGDHGGRYHGTTVYDEQVRVPLVVHAPGLIEPRRVAAPVSLVDLVPTVLAGLAIPVSPRVRGRDLGPLLLGVADDDRGFAFAESDDQTLLAEGSLRLLCARRVGACRLFDVSVDPEQREDVAARHMEAFSQMKQRSVAFVSSMGRFEAADHAQWPQPIRRGIGGDGAAALDVAALLDDADVRIRRKAAEVLFELGREETGVHLGRALRNDEDEQVRRFAALAMTRLGQGAPLVFDMLADDDVRWRRLAALTLAEAGDARGEKVLIGWWRLAFPKDPRDEKEVLPFERARQVAAALGRIKSEDAVGPLTWGLRDVRLRPFVAAALAEIGHEAARPALASAFADERYHHTREALLSAIVALGGSGELARPLARFMGVPDPIQGALAAALRADILPYVGGPRPRELRRLRRFATSGVTIGMVVPETEHGTGGLRVVVRARATGNTDAEVRLGVLPAGVYHDGDRSHDVPKRAPRLDPLLTVTLRFTPSDDFQERYADLPDGANDRVKPGEHGDFVIYATQNTEIDACAVVPRTADVAPTPPRKGTPPRP